MFSEMVAGLKNSTLPDPRELRQRFDLALVKKHGVLRQPYHCWSQDRKINPLTKHLAWAAILLEDPEAFALVEALAAQEWVESRQAKGGSRGPDPASGQIAPNMQPFIAEFLRLSPNPSFTNLLKSSLGAVTK